MYSSKTPWQPYDAGEFHEVVELIQSLFGIPLVRSLVSQGEFLELTLSQLAKKTKKIMQ